MSSNKPPRTSLSTDTWEKLRSLKEPMPSADHPTQPSSTAPEHKKAVERNADALEEAKLDSPENLKKTWQERRKEYETIIYWLCKTFPDTFNFKQPKPLKLNITHDIYAHLPDDGSISKVKLRSAIKYYTHSTFYLKALVDASDRVDLQGVATESVDPSHKDFTQTILTQRFEKKKVFKEKRPFKRPVKNIAAHD